MKQVYFEDQAIFINEDKTLINAQVKEVTEDGYENLYTRTIEVSPTEVFNEFVSQVSLEKVEENTQKYLTAVKDDEEQLLREAADKIKKELKKSDVIATDAPKQTSFDPSNISTEDLFKLKLQSFEIEEVKTSKNRELKAKIRKATSFMEVLAFTSAIILDSTGFVHTHDD